MAGFVGDDRAEHVGKALDRRLHQVVAGELARARPCPDRSPARAPSRRADARRRERRRLAGISGSKTAWKAASPDEDQQLARKDARRRERRALDAVAVRVLRVGEDGPDRDPAARILAADADARHVARAWVACSRTRPPPDPARAGRSWLDRGRPRRSARRHAAVTCVEHPARDQRRRGASEPEGLEIHREVGARGGVAIGFEIEPDLLAGSDRRRAAEVAHGDRQLDVGEVASGCRRRRRAACRCRARAGPGRRRRRRCRRCSPEDRRRPGCRAGEPQRSART